MSFLSRVFAPVTRAGWIVLAIGAIAYLLGWRLGWIELMVVAAGVITAFLLAIAFVLGRFSLSMQRTIHPDRVSVGEKSVAKLAVANKLRPSPSGIATDRIAGVDKTLVIPALGPSGSHDDQYDLPTNRRGLITIGPLVFTKADPFGLLRREAIQDQNRELIVHPATVHLPPLPAGFAKDLEGPTSEHDPKGDIAFHALREYVRGDDHRHIHWKSSARAGSLMVRQYVDNRRPHLTVVLDTDPDSFTDDSFELAVSAAASFAVAAAASSQSTAVYVDDKPIAAAAQAARLTETLDEFAMVERRPALEPIARTTGAVLSREGATTTLVVVTGARSASAVIELDLAVRGAAHLIIVRAVAPDDEALPSLARTDVINASTVQEFRAGWIRATQ